MSQEKIQQGTDASWILGVQQQYQQDEQAHNTRLRDQFFCAALTAIIQVDRTQYYRAATAAPPTKPHVRQAWEYADEALAQRNKPSSSEGK